MDRSKPLILPPVFTPVKNTEDAYYMGCGTDNSSPICNPRSINIANVANDAQRALATMINYLVGTGVDINDPNLLTLRNAMIVAASYGFN